MGMRKMLFCAIVILLLRSFTFEGIMPTFLILILKIKLLLSVLVLSFVSHIVQLCVGQINFPAISAWSRVAVAQPPTSWTVAATT